MFFSHKKIASLVCLIFLLLSALSSAKTLDVCVTGGCAYSTIQSAIDASASGDTIRVVKGTYAENVTINMKSNLILYGGFTDNTFTVRDPAQNSTVIDGKGLTNTVYIVNSDGITVDGFTIKNGQAFDGAGVKVESNGVGAKVTLTNNIISENQATWGGGIAIIADNSGTVLLDFDNNQILNNFATYGGGFAANAEHSSSIELISSTNNIMNNEADRWNNNSFGGGIYLNPVSVGSTIELNSNNDNISNNNAGGDGGGIVVYIADSANIAMTFNEATIGYNSSGFKGGGIYFINSINSSSSSILSINNSNICDNWCNQGYPAGGGIYVNHSGEFTLDLIGNNISDNNAGNGGGGGIAVLTTGENSTINLEGNVISNNGGLDSGGGIYISNNATLALNIISNKILLNKIENNGKGGGVYLENGGNMSGQITNNLVAKNGSSIFGDTNDSFNGGGVAIYDNGITNLTFCNNTITDNYTNSAVYVESLSGKTQIAFKNDILFGNKYKDLFNKSNSTSINVSYSDIGITFGEYTDSGANISLDPLFRDINSQDYHLIANSPCIDVGTSSGAPTTDIEGTPRPLGLGMDMGAYESVTITTNLLGDFGSANGGPPDCIVDFEDLMIFALAYGSTSSDPNWNPVCDIAGPNGSTIPDGVIDFEDLMVFAMNYGKTCADL